ncbi:unnamed protein product [Lactuca saligna]|uniref:Uncharacterized protein n=1 Tax=Lactuca saligna TaxID=75948 RepID=A0AA35UT00_LACSI|nr:unnamed protein product [Lactuca saligna]
MAYNKASMLFSCILLLLLALTFSMGESKVTFHTSKFHRFYNNEFQVRVIAVRFETVKPAKPIIGLVLRVNKAHLRVHLSKSFPLSVSLIPLTQNHKASELPLPAMVVVHTQNRGSTKMGLKSPKP